MSRTTQTSGAIHSNHALSASTSSATDEAGSSLHTSVKQELVETKKYYCPFLERGFCRESSKCNFSHDSNISTRVPTNFCHFYLANQCLYGQDCKFIHGEPLDELFNDLANISLTDSDQHQVEHDQYHDNYADLNSYQDYSESSSIQPGHTKDHVPNIDKQSSQNQLESRATVSIGVYNKGSLRYLSAQNPTDSTDDSTKLPPASNLHRLGSLVVADSTKIRDGENKAPITQSTVKVSEKSKDNANKVWQGGRLLASLRGEGSSRQAKLKDLPLCPFSLARGECPYPEGCCTYLHGQLCDLCCLPCLHPYDEAQQRQHRDDCLREHEREMELSFAVQRSKDKICGICMDTVFDKKPVTSSRFGILEKCNHIFCLDCIRKWRGIKQFESKTIRACPECRVSSDFVVPSKYWVEDQGDKEKLIQDYKAALRFVDNFHYHRMLILVVECELLPNRRLSP